MKTTTPKFPVALILLATVVFLLFSVPAGCSDSDSKGSSTPPAAASDLEATLMATLYVDLSWKDNSSTETGFKVLRLDMTSPAPGSFETLDITEADIVIYTDDTVVTGTEYKYQIIATNQAGDALPSNIAEVAHVITTVAGDGTGIKGYDGDGGLATDANLYFPGGLVFDVGGNLLIADSGNHVIRRIDVTTGVITTTAGDGTGIKGYDGDGGLATDAKLNFPFGLALDVAGNLFISDVYNDVIRRVDVSTGVIETVAEELTSPFGLALDVAGNLFISDSSNHVIRRVDVITGVIETVAGTGIAGYNGNSGLAIDVTLDFPSGLALNDDRYIHIVDSRNNVIRRVDILTGLIMTVAGDKGGIGGYSGDGGLATDARLNRPFSLAFDIDGNMFISDSDNHVIRRVDRVTGLIATVAGDGTGILGYIGDGELGTNAKLNFPYGLAIEVGGNLLISDTLNNVIRRVSR